MLTGVRSKETYVKLKYKRDLERGHMDIRIKGVEKRKRDMNLIKYTLPEMP